MRDEINVAAFTICKLLQRVMKGGWHEIDKNITHKKIYELGRTQKVGESKQNT